MASEGWDIGDVWRPKAYFTVGETTTIGDPTSVTLYIQSPSATTPETYTPSASTDGYYSRDTTLNESGIWRCRFKGTGAITAAGESFIEVRDQIIST